MLHPARLRVPGLLGDAPAVHPRQARQQPEDEHPGPPPRLHPVETARHLAHQLIEHAQPAARVYAVASGHRTIMILHKP